MTRLGGPHEHELSAMSGAQLGAVADAGWEVGSHIAARPPDRHHQGHEFAVHGAPAAA
jgi:hypothetical protein